LRSAAFPRRKRKMSVEILYCIEWGYLKVAAGLACALPPGSGTGLRQTAGVTATGRRSESE
jgi:hypothetical protein